MTEPDTPERVAGGALGRLAGTVKEAAGSVLRDDELAREGRLQQAEADAEREAARHEAQAREARSEAELEEEKAQTVAEARERQGEVEHDADARTAAELEREARAAEAAADAIDPEGGR